MLYSKAFLSFTYSDGCTSEFPFCMKADQQAGEDLHLSWSTAMENGEQVIRLMPKDTSLVRTARIRYILSCPEDANVFFSSPTTNGYAEVKALKEMLARPHLLKDTVLIHTPEEDLNLAVTTCDRLVTYFVFRDKWLEFTCLLENKPLPAEGLTLEHVWEENSLPAKEFLQECGRRVAERYNVRLTKPVPTGWCSWSIIYAHLNEQLVEKVSEGMTRFADRGAKLIQLDDSWQKNGIFSGEFDAADSFPSGIDAIAKKVNGDGFDFGLWLAPTIFNRDKPWVKEHEDILLHKPDGSVWTVYDKNYATLDFGNPKALDYLREIFTKCNNYGAVYYKLDFLIFSVMGFWGPGPDFEDDFVSFEGGYAVECYRRAMQVIRDTVGDRYLLCCGAPTIENAGIFDGARNTPDIVVPGNQDFWGWAVKCCGNNVYRWYWNNVLFRNDPDGVLVREYDCGDDFAPNCHEVRFLVTSCAFSGGSLLLNELPWKTAESRLELFNQILPPLGIAAEPLDFFEKPIPSVSVIDCGKKKLVAVYNTSSLFEDRVLPLKEIGCEGETVVVDAWEKKLLGAFENEMAIPKMAPHSANVYLVQPKPEKGTPLGTVDNLYMGVDKEILEGECILWA